MQYTVCYWALFAIFLCSGSYGGQIAFRLDDYQDWWITKAQQAVVDTFRDEGQNVHHEKYINTLVGLPLTIGVIANYFGSDASHVAYTKQILNDPTFDVEIAYHGYNHESFPEFDLDNQRQLISMGVQQIRATLGELQITVFLPPFNLFNADTITALKEYGFTCISDDTRDPPFPPANFNRFPTFSEIGTGNQLPASTTYQQILDSVNNHNYDTSSEHASGNDVNQEQIDQLRQLLQLCKQSGHEIVRIGKLGKSNSEPVDCTFTWGAWGACVGTCGGTGVQQRAPIITREANGGAVCPPSEYRECTPSCPGISCESNNDCTGVAVDSSYVECVNKQCRCLGTFDGNATTASRCACSKYSVQRWNGVPYCLAPGQCLGATWAGAQCTKECTGAQLPNVLGSC